MRLPSLVAHGAVQVHGRVRDLAEVVEAEHDHPGDPEEDDVVARLHHRRRVPVRQLRRSPSASPASRTATARTRTTCRARPSPAAGCRRRRRALRRIDAARSASLRRPTRCRGAAIVSCETPLRRESRCTSRPRRRRLAVVQWRACCAVGDILRQLDDDPVAVLVGAVPDGDAVAPPELAADAPVADVLHPVQVDALEALRHELDAALLHRIDRRVRRARRWFTNHCHDISGSTTVWQR